MLRACIVAFAMYSKVPMPRVEWNETSMKYALCFFPLIGVVIGGLELLYMEVSQIMGYGGVMRSCIMAVIPIIVTGGIHMDGYMDTMDALHSYQEKERKLEILKDVHIGAFAGIMLVSYYLVYVGGLSELNTREEGILLAIGFILSRTLSGLALVFFPAAKKTGTLYSFAVTADRNRVRFVLILWLIFEFSRWKLCRLEEMAWGWNCKCIVCFFIINGNPKKNSAELREIWQAGFWRYRNSSL